MIITIQTIERLLTPEQHEIIAQVIDVLHPVNGETLPRLRWVKIEEVSEGNGGVRISLAISSGGEKVPSEQARGAPSASISPEASG